MPIANIAKTDMTGVITAEQCENSTFAPIVDCNNIVCDCCDCSQTMTNKTSYALYYFLNGPDRLMSNSERILLEETLMNFSYGIQDLDVFVWNVNISLDLSNENIFRIKFDAECEIYVDLSSSLLSYFSLNSDELLTEIKKVSGLGLESGTFFHDIPLTWWLSDDDSRLSWSMNANNVPNRLPNLIETRLLQGVMFNFTSILNGNDLNMTELAINFSLFGSSRRLQDIPALIQIDATYTAQVSNNTDFRATLVSHLNSNFMQLITNIKNTSNLGLEPGTYFHNGSFDIYETNKPSSAPSSQPSSDTNTEGESSDENEGSEIDEAALAGVGAAVSFATNAVLLQRLLLIFFF